VNDKTELAFKKIYGICSYNVYGGAMVIFQDLLSSLGIKKCFLNENLKNSKKDSFEENYISIHLISKSPMTWFKFMFKYFQTSFLVYTKSKEYSMALANDFVSLLYIFPHKIFKKLDVIYFCHVAFRDTAFNKIILSRFINYSSEVIVVPSLYLKKELINMGVKASKIQCIYNGIKEFSLLKNFKNDSLNTEMKLCMVGLIQHQKGHDIFIEAIKNLNRDGYHIKGTIVGQIGERNYFEELKNQSVIAEQMQIITFKGGLDHKSTIEFMHTQDVVISLSRYRETLPTVLLEAMALKKAIIGTNIGGIPEIITDGENGYLIDSDNVNQLEHAILELKNPEHRLKLGESGYNLFRSKFNRETFINQHKLLIQGCYQKQIEKRMFSK